MKTAPLTRPASLLSLALAMWLAAAACSDPTGPPIGEESMRLTVRNWLNVDAARGVSEARVLLELFLDADVDPARAAEIEEIEVEFPAGIPVVSIPPTFEAQEDGTLLAATLFDRPGLAQGTYRLTVRFTGGETVMEEIPHDGSTLQSPVVQSVDEDDTSASIRWSAPSGHHDWSVALYRFEPDTEVRVTDLQQGSGAGGTFQVAFDVQRDPDAFYGFILVLEARHTYRRHVVPLWLD